MWPMATEYVMKRTCEISFTEQCVWSKPQHFCWVWVCYALLLSSQQCLSQIENEKSPMGPKSVDNIPDLHS